ncbi:MAG: DJ-1/PfpI family protein [Defluviitaleaceae bacterium]|nr:DJ-1/PfpI family protein [Defluviitaleaceae bacterium]
MKEVLLLLTDHWADWEASYAIAGLNATEQYAVKTISVDAQPKESIGGLRTEIDYTLQNYQGFDNLAMVILPGSFSWGEERYNAVADFVKKATDLSIPVAAICGATLFLARHGFFNSIKHTGDTQEYFFENLEDEKGYAGHDHFVAAQVVVDNGFITANETAAVDFAYEIFKVLKMDSDEEINGWYDGFKHGMIQ